MHNIYTGNLDILIPEIRDKIQLKNKLTNYFSDI